MAPSHVEPCGVFLSLSSPLNLHDSPSPVIRITHLALFLCRNSANIGTKKHHSIANLRRWSKLPGAGDGNPTVPWCSIPHTPGFHHSLMGILWECHGNIVGNSMFKKKISPKKTGWNVYEIYSWLRGPCRDISGAVHVGSSNAFGVGTPNVEGNNRFHGLKT